MSDTTEYQDHRVDPRIKLGALWASMMLVFVYVDLFSLYRRDVRADLEAGKVAGFSIGQGYLLGVIVYVIVPALMVFLSLVLPVRPLRTTSIVLAVLYAVTIAGSAVGEWTYVVLGSLTEVALLAGVAYYAWTWPKVAPGTPAVTAASHHLH